jgi:hypothetical protein
MAGPFFRGLNYTDMLVAIMLQQGADTGIDSQVIDAAGVIGPATVKRYLSSSPFVPDVVLCTTDEYCFLISGSTQTPEELIEDVLGSAQIEAIGLRGQVSAFFAVAAEIQYAEAKADFLAAASGRKVVLIGFSLGSATSTINSVRARNDGVRDAACIVFASPRVGDPEFAADVPGNFFVRVGSAVDPVPAFPPEGWSLYGIHTGLFSVPPIATYTHSTPSWVFNRDFVFRTGDGALDLLDAFALIGSGTVFQIHDHGYYGTAFRSNLPDTLPKGFDDFPRADLIDIVAPAIWDRPTPWPWPKPVPFDSTPDPIPDPPFVYPVPSTIGPTISGSGEIHMASQIALMIRDQSRQKGFEEVYYSTLPPTAASMTTLLAGLPKRQAMLAKPVVSPPLTGMEIFAARISNVGSPRQSVFKRFATPMVGTYSGPSLQGMADVEDAVVFEAFDASLLYRRVLHFRGVDASVLLDENLSANGTGSWLPLAVGPGSWTDWLIGTGGFVIHAGRPSGSAGIPIVGATSAGAGSPIVISYGGPGQNPGTLFEIRGSRQAPLLNGRWQNMHALAAGTLTLSGSSRYGVPVAMDGSVFPVTPTYVAVVAPVALLGGGSKKTGRPPLSPRGRQSARLRRR